MSRQSLPKSPITQETGVLSRKCAFKAVKEIERQTLSYPPTMVYGSGAAVDILDIAGLEGVGACLPWRLLCELAMIGKDALIS